MASSEQKQPAQRRQNSNQSKSRSSTTTPATVQLIKASVATLLAVVYLINQSPSLISRVECAPTLFGGGYMNPWEIPFRHNNHRLHQQQLRDPMPWEDGYFDPSYHAWPKQPASSSARSSSSQQQQQQQVAASATGDKQSSKLMSEVQQKRSLAKMISSAAAAAAGS